MPLAYSIVSAHKTLAITLVAFLALFISSRNVIATTIDVMLVFDRTAAIWVKSNGGITAFAQDAVNRMNLATNNSDLDLQFRLVYAMESSYIHQDISSDLNELTEPVGSFTDIHSLRNEYGADLVALLVDTGSAYGTVGQAWLLSSYGGEPDYAFSVTAVRSVAISHTLTHEIGHNLGADHAKNQIFSPGPNWYLDNQYSAGWYFQGSDGSDYHTIMAYDDDGYGGSYQEAPLFSTPLLHYYGGRAGDTLDGDNTRLLSQTMSTVAGYRESQVPPGGFEPGSLQVFLTPEAVTFQGAQWRRKGTHTWHDSGYTEENVVPGQYILEFKKVEQWRMPILTDVEVHDGENVMISRSYRQIQTNRGLPWLPLLILDGK